MLFFTVIIIMFAVNFCGIQSYPHSDLVDDILLQEDLVELMPMVLEANAISEELNKKMFFEIALVSPQARGLKDGHTEVRWCVISLCGGGGCSCNKFNDLGHI